MYFNSLNGSGDLERSVTMNSRFKPQRKVEELRLLTLMLNRYGAAHKFYRSTLNPSKGAVLVGRDFAGIFKPEQLPNGTWR